MAQCPALLNYPSKLDHPPALHLAVLQLAFDMTADTTPALQNKTKMHYTLYTSSCTLPDASDILSNFQQTLSVASLGGHSLQHWPHGSQHNAKFPPKECHQLDAMATRPAGTDAPRVAQEHHPNSQYMQ